MIPGSVSTEAIPATGWMDRARCVTERLTPAETDFVFFDGKASEPRREAFCRACPVRLHCSTWHLAIRKDQRQ